MGSMFWELLLHLDAAANAKKDLDQQEIGSATSPNVREHCIELKILFFQLDETVKAVVRIGANFDERSMDGSKHLRLELRRLGRTTGDRDDGHGSWPVGYSPERDNAR